jgi:hypothetical protein
MDTSSLSVPSRRPIVSAFRAFPHRDRIAMRIESDLRAGRFLVFFGEVGSRKPRRRCVRMRNRQ